MKVYVDTCVYVDLFEGGSKAALAYNFFSKGWKCVFELVVSDWVRSELKKRGLDSEYPLLFDNFKKKNKYHFVEHTKEELELAKSKSDHWQDYLHYLIAKKTGCDKIVTNDNEFISSVSPIFDIVYPENV
ncbi:MAG: type II toxin-antitoxin system VapC family toxin [Candidatus Woesearchaeota archaeon]